MNNNMGKGRIAENIVASLFKKAGFKVIKYGYEHTVKKLANRNALIKGKAGEYIRHQPDFIIVNNENEAFFVEVKFRSKMIIPEKEIFPFPNCYVVLLTKGSILAQNIDDLLKKKADFVSLKKITPFEAIPNELIEDHVMKVRRQLGDDTLINQGIGKIVERFSNRKYPLKKSQPLIIKRNSNSRFTLVRDDGDIFITPKSLN